MATVDAGKATSEAGEGSLDHWILGLCISEAGGEETDEISTVKEFVFCNEVYTTNPSWC